MIYIYPYKLYSESARKLRDGLSSALGYRVRLVKPDGKFNPRRRDIVINWGSTRDPDWETDGRDRNIPINVFNAADKLRTFKYFKVAEVQTPEWTEDKDVAKSWFDKKGTTVLCRTVLNGHSGAGIHVAGNPDELVGCPLYVKYKKKKAEYRVHVIFGKVVDKQQKRKRNGFKENVGFNHLIRNHHTGWVYCREGIPNDQRLDDLAIKAVKALGLDFGAVDIIYNEKENEYYVLEVNTAPGLDGTTVDKYVGAFV